jgi:hypothetical protein
MTRLVRSNNATLWLSHTISDIQPRHLQDEALVFVLVDGGWRAFFLNTIGGSILGCWYCDGDVFDGDVG